MRAIAIAIEIGSGNRLQVRLLELVARLECLLEDRVGEKVAHFQAHQGLATTGRGRIHLCFEAIEWRVFKLEQSLAFDANRVDECGHGFPQSQVGNERESKPDSNFPPV